MKKNKRGRPKGSKNKVKADKKLVQSINAVAEPVKRGRGRPRKDSTLTPTPTPTPTKTNLEKFVDVEASENAEDVNKVLAAKRGRKPKGEESSIFKKVEKKEERNGWTYRYMAYKDVPAESMIEPDVVAKGSRVLVSSYPDFYRIYFKKYHEAGEPGWLNGGIEVYNANNQRSEGYRRDQVAVHPKGGSIRLAETPTGELVPVGPVPVSNRDARFVRKAEKREKKMAKEAKKKLKADIREAKEEIKKLNKQKKGLKPKQKKEIRDQIKQLKNIIVDLKKDLVKTVAVIKGEASTVNVEE